MQTEASTEVIPAAAAPAVAPTTPEAAPASAVSDGSLPIGIEAPAAAQDDSEQEQQRAQHRNKVQDRINELTFKRNQAEREAAHWKSVAETRQAPAAPNAAEFDSDEDYQTALLDHRVRTGVHQGLAENAQATATKFSQDAQAATAEAYNQRVQETAQRLPDFAEVVSKANIDISPALQSALMDSEVGPDLVYHLAKNPMDAQRLSQLPEKQLLREIWNMEVSVGKKAVSTAPAARTTSAPPPIKPGSAASAPANNDPAKMTQQEYESWRKSNGSKYIR